MKPPNLGGLLRSLLRTRSGPAGVFWPGAGSWRSFESSLDSFFAFFDGGLWPHRPIPLLISSNCKSWNLLGLCANGHISIFSLEGSSESRRTRLCAWLRGTCNRRILLRWTEDVYPFVLLFKVNQNIPAQPHLLNFILYFQNLQKQKQFTQNPSNQLSSFSYDKINLFSLIASCLCLFTSFQSSP